MKSCYFFVLASTLVVLVAHCSASKREASTTNMETGTTLVVREKRAPLGKLALLGGAALVGKKALLVGGAAVGAKAIIGAGLHNKAKYYAGGYGLGPAHTTAYHQHHHYYAPSPSYVEYYPQGSAWGASGPEYWPGYGYY